MKQQKSTYASSLGDITLVKMTNATGASVTISTLGAGIVEISVPDANGNIADVVLGYANPADYVADGPCAGKVPGRYANRIANGRFAIDGREYHLAINNGPNALHGGPTGFMNQLWTISELGDDFITLTLQSADGHEGYPGNLAVKATYRWSDDCQLTLDLSATTDSPTVINLTNHCYFNLEGHDAGSALHHSLQLNASHYLPTDPTLVPTGEFAPVEGTPMDFTVAHEIGRDIEQDFPALKYGKGYDNCWVLAESSEPRVAAVLTAPGSRRRLTVTTDQPAVQVYTGNWLTGCPKSKSQTDYADYDGVAIECQGMPDAPNKPQFPSQTLRPGETYSRTIRFSFDTF